MSFRGFVGEATYEFPAGERGTSNLELLQPMLTGELVHVGKHTAWGTGWYGVGGAA
jgi:CRISPR/Cas system endoribonuclease Cas6 (RAMP superfamily)